MSSISCLVGLMCPFFNDFLKYLLHICVFYYLLFDLYKQKYTQELKFVGANHVLFVDYSYSLPHSSTLLRLVNMIITEQKCKILKDEIFVKTKVMRHDGTLIMHNQ